MKINNNLNIVIFTLFITLGCLFSSNLTYAQSTVEMINYSGEITGSIKDLSGQYLSGVNVSLWQNGQILKSPENPQLASRNYSFGHLAPGQYELSAVMIHFEQFAYTKSIEVKNDTVTMDIVIPFYWTQIAPTQQIIPTISKITSIPDLSVTPAPLPGIMEIVITISIGIICIKFIKTH